MELDIQQNTEQFLLDFPTNLNENLKKSKIYVADNYIVYTIYT